MDDVGFSSANYGECSIPCKVKTYHATEVGLTDNGNRGLAIRFENKVDIIKLSWQMNEISLLSKIGGFIGISKNFLWLMIMLVSSIITLMSYFKKF